eukprot:6186180-Pleurochrysis_carterae.AAC.5
MQPSPLKTLRQVEHGPKPARREPSGGCVSPASTLESEGGESLSEGTRRSSLGAAVRGLVKGSSLS